MDLSTHRTPTRTPRSPESGNALLTALLLLVLVSTGLAALLSTAVQASEAPRDRADRFEVKRAGHSANKLAAQSVFSAYQATLAGEEASLGDMRASLTAMGYTDQSAAAVPVRTEIVDRLGLGANSDGEIVLGDIEIESVLLHRMDRARATHLVVTTTTMARRGWEGASTNVRDSVTDVFTLEPARWDGLDFAILANNINCIMCHTNVDDARRVYDGAGIAAGGQYSRARVGSIESFQIRHDPDSAIAGTLYLGGSAVDDDGDAIADWSAFTMMGGMLDSDGRILEDGFGDAMLGLLTPADPADPAPFENLYVDYFDQPNQVDGILPDRFPLPFRDDGGFDPVTGDPTVAGAGNRIVDDNEFATTTESFSGAITNGAIGVVPPGDRVTSTVAAARLTDGTEATLGSVTAGNVVLTGTPDDPIRITGDVAIDGDLIISGPIEGSGSLWVRGNIYIPSDLEYADRMRGSDREFGLGANGNLNALGLTAGGNILMGDLYRAQWGEGAPVDGTESGNWNFTLEQTAIFNRGEWVKTQPELPGLPERVAVGTHVERRELMDSVPRTERRPITELRDTGRTQEVPVYDQVVVGTREEPVFETVVVPATRPAPYGSPTTERRQVGTRTVDVTERRQVGTRTEPIRESVTVGYEDVVVYDSVPFDPPQYVDEVVTDYEIRRPMHTNDRYEGPNYVPRYYALGEGDVVPVQNKRGWFDPELGLWHSEELVGGWDTDELTLADPSDPNDPLLFPAGRPAAAIETLEPTGEWIDPGVLQGMIEDALAARDAGAPFKVDATLYSANSIFGLVPDSPGEGTNGELLIEGSILSADIGLLGPNGTDVLYDPRSQAVLDIRDESNIQLKLVGGLPGPRL